MLMPPVSSVGTPSRETRNISLGAAFLRETQLLPCVKWPPGVIRMLLFLLISCFLQKCMHNLYSSPETFFTYCTNRPNSLRYLFSEKLTEPFSSCHQTIKGCQLKTRSPVTPCAHGHTNYYMHSLPLLFKKGDKCIKPNHVDLIYLSRTQSH